MTIHTSAESEKTARATIKRRARPIMVDSRWYVDGHRILSRGQCVSRVNVCGGQTFCGTEQKRRQSNIDNSQWQKVDASVL
jgi:hypothetical protein